MENFRRQYVIYLFVRLFFFFHISFCFPYIYAVFRSHLTLMDLGWWCYETVSVSVMGLFCCATRKVIQGNAKLFFWRKSETKNWDYKWMFPFLPLRHDSETTSSTFFSVLRKPMGNCKFWLTFLSTWQLSWFCNHEMKQIQGENVWDRPGNRGLFMEKTWIFILEESQPELHSLSQFKKASRHF